MKRAGFAALPFLVCALAFINAKAWAQAPQSNPAEGDTAKESAELNIQMIRQDIRANRKEITAFNMNLTPDEAAKFWPIYDQYIQETIKINDARWNLMKDYAANYDKLTDEHAQNYMKQAATVDQQLIALRVKYIPMFEKVISSRKTALWYQIDRRLDLIINLQLAGLAPLVDTTK